MRAWKTTPQIPHRRKNRPMRSSRMCIGRLRLAAMVLTSLMFFAFSTRAATHLPSLVVTTHS